MQKNVSHCSSHASSRAPALLEGARTYVPPHTEKKVKQVVHRNKTIVDVTLGPAAAPPSPVSLLEFAFLIAGTFWVIM